MLLHIFNAMLASKPDVPNPSDGQLLIANPIATVSFCMPETNKLATARSYQVNAVYRQQLDLFDEPDDDEEMINGDQDAN